MHHVICKSLLINVIDQLMVLIIVHLVFRHLTCLSTHTSFIQIYCTSWEALHQVINFQH